MRRAGVASFLVLLAVGLAVWIVPWAVEDRPVSAGVPSPRALDAITEIPLAPGQQACARGVGLDERTDVVRMDLVGRETPRPPLALSVRGEGYATRVLLPASSPADTAITAPVPSPGRDVLVTVCVRNRGEDPAVLAASADRTRSRADAVIDGRSAQASPWISLAEDGTSSMVGRAGEVLSRMATFRPGFAFPPVLGLIAILVLLALPVGVGLAWAAALGKDEDGDETDA